MYGCTDGMIGSGNTSLNVKAILIRPTSSFLPPDDTFILILSVKILTKTFLSDRAFQTVLKVESILDLLRFPLP